MIGTEIGNYRIVEKIGAGGMGVVYKAIDTHLDRVVAVKALSPEFSGDPALLERFRGEARAQAQLNHPNLATLYAFLVQDDVAYMVMEFVDGETFHAMVARRGPIPAAEAVPLFRQALAGIGYAHRLGIVHRDIKPSNIMLNCEGVVKVMDFGLAKVAGGHGVTRTDLGDRLCASPGNCAPRYQAQQHHAELRGRREGDGLRARQSRRRPRSDAHRGAVGNGLLHVARADTR